MYNPEVKARFLETLNDTLQSKRTYSRMFKRTEPFERGINKDVCEFNLRECIELTAFLNPKLVGHVGMIKSQFFKYTSWAVNNNIATKNYWALVPIQEDLAKREFSMQHVKDIDELVKFVDTAIVSVYDKYVPYLAYMGIMGTKYVELRFLKDSDIDLTNRTITTVRKKYNYIIEPLYKLLRTPKDYWGEVTSRDEDSIYLIKPFVRKDVIGGNPPRESHIHNTTDKFIKGIQGSKSLENKNLIPSNVRRSGLFYSMYQIEQAKGSIISDDYLKIRDDYGHKIAFSSFMKDYELYKEIFWEEVVV